MEKVLLGQRLTRVSKNGFTNLVVFVKFYSKFDSIESTI